MTFSFSKMLVHRNLKQRQIDSILIEFAELLDFGSNIVASQNIVPCPTPSFKIEINKYFHYNQKIKIKNKKNGKTQAK